MKWLPRKIGPGGAGRVENPGGEAVLGRGWDGLGAASEAERIRANRLIAKVAATIQERRGETEKWQGNRNTPEK